MSPLRVRSSPTLIGLLSLLLLGSSALAASGAPAAGGEEERPRILERVYRVHFLEDRDLRPLLGEFCSLAEAFTCQASFHDGYVRLNTTEKMHAQFTAWLEARDVPPPTQVFHVHLFAADNGAPSSDPIPDALGPVLKELAGFLPFRTFRLISTGLLRTSRQGRIDLGSEPHFVVDLQFAGDPAGGKPLQIEQFELVRRQMVPGEGGAMQMASVDVLRTSFSMRVGETVVVGTSKLNGGDTALVVLLTAVK